MVPDPMIAEPQRVADFLLPDHRGRMFRLSNALLHAPLIVVFFRGHWCPYCRRYLTKLQAHLRQFQQRGAQLIAISPEPPNTSAALASQLGLSFPILSDADGRVIELFCVRNRFSAAMTLLPHASVFVLGSDGRIGFRSVDRNYKKRTTMRTILSALRPLESAVG
jgi:peroxiredoxin